MDFRAYKENGLLLPPALAAEMRALEVNRELQQQMDKMRAEMDAVPEKSRKKDLAAELRSAYCQWNEMIRSYTGPKHVVFDAQEADAMLDQIDAHEDAARHRVSLQIVARRTPISLLARVPLQFRKQLDTMQAMLPNFAPVLDYLRAECAIGAHQMTAFESRFAARPEIKDLMPCNGALTFAPLLLVGPPGIGKTLFATELAKFCGTDLLTLRMENAQSNSALSGSDAFWSNSRPGDFWRTLLTSRHANFVTFVDEIDKVTADRYDPLAALYSLLEPLTSKEFRDLCFPQLALDASRALWVATANDLSRLPQPLLSRFKIFHIQPPTAVQSRQIAEAVLGNAMFDAELEMPIDVGVLEKLAVLPPRRMQQAAREAIGRALLADHDGVYLEDVPDDTVGHRRMGF